MEFSIGWNPFAVLALLDPVDDRDLFHPRHDLFGTAIYMPRKGQGWCQGGFQQRYPVTRSLGPGTKRYLVGF